MKTVTSLYAEYKGFGERVKIRHRIMRECIVTGRLSVSCIFNLYEINENYLKDRNNTLNTTTEDYRRINNLNLKYGLRI